MCFFPLLNPCGGPAPACVSSLILRPILVIILFFYFSFYFRSGFVAPAAELWEPFWALILFGGQFEAVVSCCCRSSGRCVFGVLVNPAGALTTLSPPPSCLLLLVARAAALSLLRPRRPDPNILIVCLFFGQKFIQKIRSFTATRINSEKRAFTSRNDWCCAT